MAKEFALLVEELAQWWNDWRNSRHFSETGRARRLPLIGVVLFQSLIAR